MTNKYDIYMKNIPSNVILIIYAEFNLQMQQNSD